jgi:hypothetical protein
MKVIRVFPRRTKATPTDENVRIGVGPGLFDECDEVHVSCTFSWDLPRAEQLAEEWKTVAPVKLGGPATGMRGEEFTPGMYVRNGYTITSRGCPNRCWFCDVWKREGPVRELPIMPGNNILDDNLLACSEEHIRKVFGMLETQRGIQFTGGLEAARLEWWHVLSLRGLRPQQLFFAYDTPDDLPHLRRAGEMLLDAGFTKGSHSLRAFVLVGYPKDTTGAAENRMYETISAGFLPMAMLWRDRDGKRDHEWMRWARTWSRPAIISSQIRDMRKKEAP